MRVARKPAGPDTQPGPSKYIRRSRGHHLTLFGDSPVSSRRCRSSYFFPPLVFSGRRTLELWVKPQKRGGAPAAAGPRRGTVPGAAQLLLLGWLPGGEWREKGYPKAERSPPAVPVAVMETTNARPPAPPPSLLPPPRTAVSFARADLARWSRKCSV